MRAYARTSVRPAAHPRARRRRLIAAAGLAAFIAAAAGAGRAAPPDPQFLVQAGAFRVEAFAHERCDPLAAAGLPLALTREQRRGSAMFLCRSTARYARPAAEALAARVRAQGGNDVALVAVAAAPPRHHAAALAKKQPAAGPAKQQPATAPPKQQPAAIDPALRDEFARFLAEHPEELEGSSRPQAAAPEAAAPPPAQK